MTPMPTTKPQPPKAMMRSASDPASTVAATQKRILVVDDDPQIRESLGKVLRAEAYDVLLAADGQEGIEIFETRRIDLVLLDISLPGNGGWEVFGALTSSNPFLPIIIITGREDQQALATLAGVGALVEKPLDVPLLLKTITELIAEESETHLKRLAGLRHDLRYVAPAPQHNVHPTKNQPMNTSSATFCVERSPSAQMHARLRGK